MMRRISFLCLLALLVSAPAGASDPISAGSITNFAYHGGYVVFKVVSGPRAGAVIPS